MLRKLIKIFLWTLAAISVFLFAVVIVYWKTTFFESATQKYLNGVLKEKGSVQYSALEGGLLNRIVLKDLAVHLRDQADLTASHVEIHYGIWAALRGELRISSILVGGLNLEIYPSGSTPKSESAGQDIDSVLRDIQEMHLADSLFHLLPIMQIAQIQIYADTIKLKVPEIMFSDVQILLDKALVSEKNYRLQVRKISGTWVQKKLSLKNLSFQLEGDRNHITLNQFNLETDYSKFSLSAYYALKGVPDINLNIYEFQLGFEDLYKLTALEVLRKGVLKGSFSVSGAPLKFGADLHLSGHWRKQVLRQFDAQADYDHGMLDLKQLDILANQTRLSVFGQSNQFKTGSARLEFKNLNLKAFDTTQVFTDLSGNLQFEVGNLNLKRATGKGTLHILPSVIDQVHIDSLNFALKAERGNFEIVQPSFVKISDSIRFNLEGSVSRKGIIDASLSTFDNQIGGLAPLLNIDSLDAVYDGLVHLGGKLTDPSVSGNLWMPKMRYHDVYFDSVLLNLNIRDLFSERQGEANFEIKKGRYADFPFQNILINARIDGNRASLEQMQFFSGKDFLSASVELNYDSLKSTIKLPTLEMVYDGYRLLNDGPVQITLNQREINIDQFELAGPEGSGLAIGGFWDFAAEDLQAYFSFKKLQLQPFEPFWQKTFSLSGKVDGYLELYHPIHSAEIESELRITDLVYDHVELGNLNSDLFFAGNLFDIREFSIEKNEMLLEAEGGFQFNLENDIMDQMALPEDTETKLNLAWRNLDISHFAPLLNLKQKISGRSSGYFELGGSTGHPQFSQYFGLTDFKYEAFRADSVNCYSQYNDGFFLLDSLSGILNNTSFDLRGWLKYNLNLASIDTAFLNNPMEFVLRSNDDDISFIGLLNDQVEALKGAYDLELHLGGTPEQPALKSGFMKMDDGQLLLSRVRDPLRRVKIDAVVQDSVLTLNEFSAYSTQEKDLMEKAWGYILMLFPGSHHKLNEGRILVKGMVGTSDLVHPKMDLKVRLDEFYVNYFIENATVVLNSNNLKIRGQDTLRVSGKITVPKGTYEVDLSQMEKNIYLSEATVQSTPPYTAVNLSLVMPGNFVVSSSPLDLANNFKIVMMGDLQLIIEPPSDETQIAGHLETISGKYASWNQNFDVQNGTIDFKNPKEINPDIDLLVVKKIGQRTFEVLVTGNLKKMSQKIRITENGEELEMSYLDKVTMLTLGADIQQITSQTDSTFRKVGEDVATTSVLTAVERGAEKYIGLDKVEISKNEMLLDLERMRLNNGLSDASISFGKYLTSDLYVEYQTQFGGDFPTPKISWQAGNRLGLQYRISRLWSVDSYYEKTDRGNNKIQLGIKWELTF